MPQWREEAHYAAVATAAENRQEVDNSPDGIFQNEENPHTHKKHDALELVRLQPSTRVPPSCVPKKYSRKHSMHRNAQVLAEAMSTVYQSFVRHTE